MPAFSHIKSNIVADFTGTVTVFNSAGITKTVNATDLVRPGDWNSAHNFFQTIAGNTAGQSTASGTNLVYGGTNGISLSLSTGASIATLWVGQSNPIKSGLNPYADVPMVAGQVGQGTLIFDPTPLPDLQFDRILLPIINTNSSNSSGSHTLSFWVGLYTRTQDSMSLWGSTSGSTAITHSGTAGSYSLYSGIRHFSIPWTTTVPEGQYYLGALSRTTSGGTNGSYSQVVLSNIASNFQGFFGASNNTTQQFTLGQGVYTVTTNGLPGSVGFSQIRGSDSAGLRAPVVIFASSTV